MLKLLFTLVALMSVCVLGACNVSCTNPFDGTCASPLESRWTDYTKCVNDPTQAPLAFVLSPIPNIPGLSAYIIGISGLDPGTYNDNLDVNDWVVFGQIAPAVTFPKIPLVVTRVTIRSDDVPSVDLYIYRPSGSFDLLPAFVYFHPGGFQYTRAVHYDHWARKIFRATGAAVVLVDYNNTRRGGAENAFPVASRQGARAIRYLKNNDVAVGINGSRLTVYGESAGGQIAVSSILRARDQGFTVEKCVLGAPFLDVESRTVPVADAISTAFVYSREQIIEAWTIYSGGDLRSLRGNNTYFNVFSLFQEKNYAGLPRFLIIGAGFDPLRQEAQTFSSLLRNAGVNSTYLEIARVPHAAWLYDKIYPVESSLVLGLLRAF